jgi:hypothetical protein
MVSIPEAVKKTKEFAQALFEISVTDLRLEEIQSGSADGQPVWLITLSAPSVSAMLFARPAAGQVNGRDYKTFTVSKDSGEVLAMKIREFAA